MQFVFVSKYGDETWFNINVQLGVPAKLLP